MPLECGIVSQWAPMTRISSSLVPHRSPGRIPTTLVPFGMKLSNWWRVQVQDQQQFKEMCRFGDPLITLSCMLLTWRSYAFFSFNTCFKVIDIYLFLMSFYLWWMGLIHNVTTSHNWKDFVIILILYFSVMLKILVGRWRKLLNVHWKSNVQTRPPSQRFIPDIQSATNKLCQQTASGGEIRLKNHGTALFFL